MRYYVEVTVEMWPVQADSPEEALEKARERVRRTIAGENLHQLMINSYRGDFKVVREEKDVL